jgi:hypothetical protein
VLPIESSAEEHSVVRPVPVHGLGQLSAHLLWISRQMCKGPSLGGPFFVEQKNRHPADDSQYVFW